MAKPKTIEQELVDQFDLLLDRVSPPGEFVRYRARRLAERHVARFPTSAVALSILGAACDLDGDLNKASEYFEQAFDSSPTLTATNNFLLSKIRLQDGQGAADVLSAISERFPDYPTDCGSTLRVVNALALAGRGQGLQELFAEAIQLASPQSADDMMRLALTASALGDDATSGEFIGRFLCILGLLEWKESGIHSLADANPKDVSTYFGEDGLRVLQRLALQEEPKRLSPRTPERSLLVAELMEEMSPFLDAANRAVLGE